MFAFSLLAAAAVAPLVFAQDTTLGLQAIKAHFKQSNLVPDLFASFEPTALVTVAFSGLVLQPGQNLTREQVAPDPTVTVTPGNSSATYTLAMLDAGTVVEKPSQQTRHWLVNSVHVSGTTVVANSSGSSVEITGYAGPAPPIGSGPHRYVVVLYNQPDSFHAPDGLSTPVAVSTFVWADYVKNASLGPLVGATYFTVEGGERTVSIPATSPVVTQVLFPRTQGRRPLRGLQAPEQRKQVA